MKDSKAITAQISSVRKPPNAFFVYRKAMLSQITKKHNTTKSHEVSRIAGQMWAKEPEGVRSQYQKLAMIARELHLQKYPDFKWPSKKFGKKQRSRLRLQEKEEEKELFNLETSMPIKLEETSSETSGDTCVQSDTSEKRDSISSTGSLDVSNSLEKRPSFCESISDSSTVSNSPVVGWSQYLDAFAFSALPDSNLGVPMYDMPLLNDPLANFKPFGLNDYYLNDRTILLTTEDIVDSSFTRWGISPLARMGNY
ncbi:hypothetical protein HDV06_002479 [Boothiomyces sp. JEL0866]|nr:hypothetical protein HDV06_002479 [Boothiomyces sp. JEL0866]